MHKLIEFLFKENSYIETDNKDYSNLLDIIFNYKWILENITLRDKNNNKIKAPVKIDDIYSALHSESDIRLGLDIIDGESTARLILYYDLKFVYLKNQINWD